MIIHEALYAWCLRYHICSTWFLDIKYQLVFSECFSFVKKQNILEGIIASFNTTMSFNKEGFVIGASFTNHELVQLADFSITYLAIYQVTLYHFYKEHILRSL